MDKHEIEQRNEEKKRWEDMIAADNFVDDFSKSLKFIGDFLDTKTLLY